MPSTTTSVIDTILREAYPESMRRCRPYTGPIQYRPTIGTFWVDEAAEFDRLSPVVWSETWLQAWDNIAVAYTAGVYMKEVTYDGLGSINNRTAIVGPQSSGAR